MKTKEKINSTIKCTAYPEMDMAKLYRYAIKIVRNRSFVIEGWNGQLL